MLLAVHIFHGFSSQMCLPFVSRHLVICLLRLVTSSPIHSSFFIHHFTLHFIRHLVTGLLHLVTRRSSLVTRRSSSRHLFITPRHSSFVILHPSRHSSLVTSSLHSSLVTRQWRATPPQKAIKGRQRSQLDIYLVLWTPPRPTRWAIH